MKKNAFLFGLLIAIYCVIKLYGRPGTEAVLDDTEQMRVNTALIEAAKNNEYDQIVTLERIYGADINAVDDMGRTPLMWAALNSHTSAVEKILGFSPNVNLQDNDGNAAAHLALLPSPDQLVNSEERVNANDYKVLRMILAAGENPLIRNNAGKTILDLAQDKAVQDRMTRETIRMIRRYKDRAKVGDAAWRPCPAKGLLPDATADFDIEPLDDVEPLNDLPGEGSI